MMMQNDVLRDFDRLVQRTFNTQLSPERVNAMPMDAWRDEQGFHAEIDLPGIDPESIDVAIERNVMTIRAQRPKPEGRRNVLGNERVWGHFSREFILGEHLDTENISANYADGVLSLDIGLAESAKPRKIKILRGKSTKSITR
ncbi:MULTISPECIES: Hsp20/alpha crystallin family protein [unclassified Glutamicibacter]|uniref:Hsp20/alpha crystallin family protein n=1 Tax=Glutamicibacter bergerei TaxID=256702 RepID=A0ABV9MN49_9MICC|nr:MULTISPECIES: Hsp20/alpha crystallin family protein [unclassified Glutamicibacter]PCC27799.1 hypothetical protein CIK76_15215 [Glutamicibacter sp. BW80]PCC36559.1 hypothetical protein CIK74_05260 [Glutamicibacter sp. BW77]HBV10846.1 Hsp20/alpha crystallin family protein [Micrococcaceae bacterium]